MEEDVTDSMGSVREALLKYPGPVVEAYDSVAEAMPEKLAPVHHAAWERAGLEIAQQTVRSWEAAAAYYRVSPIVVSFMPFNYFAKWTECGSSLCQQSPSIATAYFEASPAAMAKMRSRHIESWSNLGRNLYRGTWKSSALACKFYASSGPLLENLTFRELERFAGFLEALSHRSYELTSECLALGEDIFPLIGEDKDAFISLASTLVESNWRELKSFFEAGSKALPRIESGQRLRFLNMAERLVRGGGTNIPIVMLEVSQSLARLEADSHERVLALSESLLDSAPAAVPEFIKACPQVLERVTPNQMERWFEEGVRVLGQNREGGLAYFKIESSHSEEVLETLSSGVEFGRIKTVMEMYCRALAGADVKLSESEELVNKNIGWVSNESPSTEGSTVFVPTLVDRYSTKDENFSWFKVVSTHQVAHLEFGSFRFEFDAPTALFPGLRHDLEQRRSAEAVSGDDLPEVDPASLEQGWVTDMGRFFNLFSDRKLALDIFTVVEDGRLDATVKSEYRGIRRAYLKVQEDSLEGRPEIKSLPAREAMVELMVRVSLQQPEALSTPAEHVETARKIVGITRRVLTSDAEVEDVAEATLRIYALIFQIPNEEVPPEEWQDLDGDEDDEYEESEDMQQLLQQLAMGADVDSRPEGEEEYDSSQEVDFRGDFKPELVQLLTQLRMQPRDGDGEGGGDQITQEMLEEMLENSSELDIDAAPGEITDSSQFANNLMKEAGANRPETPESGQGPFVHVDEDGGALDPSEPQTFVYDEWDFRADDYKPRWCVVRQKVMPEGDAGYFGMTLHNYGSLVTRVRRQFELMVPETFRKVRKLEDGEEIDIDDVIEAIVDMRTGSSPSEKLYWRRNKVQRDVAVAFLLDTSASTAEAIDEAKKAPDDWNAPDDPVEYMVWLRTRRGEAMRRSYKRIVDVEKEAIVLLMNALEAIGDVYGIYGFSGYGRENVEFYTIKDLDEAFSERVKRRIDRIAPLHATRMGPAIRHATYKLDKQYARTKLLFLISDGRPQDRGYSREGVEKEYAVHDTKMALDEARNKDINAFCLTVDKNGHDYLKTMCQDIGYEVLDDIYTLPERLLFLYRRLTM